MQYHLFCLCIVVDSKHDVIMITLMNYPDFILYFFDFLLTITMITSTSTTTIILNIIVVVTARLIIKPVLELSLVDAKIGKHKGHYKIIT